MAEERQRRRVGLEVGQEALESGVDLRARPVVADPIAEAELPGEAPAHLVAAIEGFPVLGMPLHHVVDDPAELERLARFGLYAVGTNRPGVLLQALADGLLED